MKPQAMFDQKKAIEMAESGMDYGEIAKSFDLTPATFAVVMGALGYHRNARAVRRQKMMELFEQGLSVKQIAREVDMSTEHVRSELKRMGARKRRA